MIVKLSKIVNSVPAFKTITSQATIAKSAFRLAKVLNTIQVELDAFETAKNTISAKYQETVDGKIQIPESKAEDFKKEIIDLLEEDIELNCEPLNITDLAGMNITISNMMLMEYLFKE